MSLLTCNINWLHCSLIIDEIICQGINQFYISSGMRNAPLIAAINNDQRASFQLCNDERSAGFQALGYAKATNKPAVLICTSGSALTHYYPAIVEASKSSYPIIVLSADRPKELVNSGANQTIEQLSIFSKFCSVNQELPTPTQEVCPKKLKSSVGRTIFQALNLKSPVHINMAFREPLDGVKTDISPEYEKQAEKLFGHPSTKFYPTISIPSNSYFDEKVLIELEKANAPLIVFGTLKNGWELSSLCQKFKEKNIPYYTDISSQLKFRTTLKQGSIPCFAHNEMFELLEDYQSDLIIHLGGAVVAKNYLKFLKKHSPRLFCINQSRFVQEPMEMATDFLNTDPITWSLNFFKNIDAIEKKSKVISWGKFIGDKKKIIEDSPLCFPQISKSLIEIIEDNSVLYLGNSTTIRSFDCYTSNTTEKNIEVITHRGASGIEGLIASAIGFSQNCSRPLTAVLGDLSLLHDVGSLQILKNTPNPMTLIVVNNDGGGIFSLLPFEQRELVNESLQASHEQSFEKIAYAFNLSYSKVNDLKTFIQSYKENSGKLHLIEARIANQDNIECYKKLRTIHL